MGLGVVRDLDVASKPMECHNIWTEGRAVAAAWHGDWSTAREILWYHSRSKLFKVERLDCAADLWCHWVVKGKPTDSL